MSDTQDRRKQHQKRSAMPCQRSEKKIPRARPVEGEIDHAALTQEIIARFPKILAELAK